uniref:Nucleosome assembly protein 1 like 1 n=1 Tax=Cebus imitator TaxID=2715852 RepID=A0A2K5RWY9_CEBIM
MADTDNLPTVVKRRVNALNNLQVKCAQTEEEVQDLERKYAVLYQPLFDKQFEIINAIYEPMEEKCEQKPDDDEILEELKEKAKIKDEKKDEEKEDPKGIPEFWLTVFKNVDLLSDMVQEHDEPILKHLKDIKVKVSEPNEYFTNEYEVRADDSHPFSFDRPEIMGCNVTLKTIKQQQKHKGHGTVHTVIKTVSNDNGDLDDDAEAIFAAVFEIGHFLHEHIIPRSVSVLYFTREAIEDDDDDDDDDEGDEGEEADEKGEEGDEENDPDSDPKDQNAAKCKQQ